MNRRAHPPEDGWQGLRLESRLASWNDRTPVIYVWIGDCCPDHTVKHSITARTPHGRAAWGFDWRCREGGLGEGCSPEPLLSLRLSLKEDVGAHHKGSVL